LDNTAKKVLVIEDETALSHALSLKLTHEGFMVSVAGNGQQGLELMQQEQFDVVLLDLIMPVMDGFQVLEKMRTLPAMPVVFVLSNLSQHEDEGRAMALGARKFFIKSDTALTTIVEEVKSA
jgi:DNA-binding response OmpR family regulator